MSRRSWQRVIVWSGARINNDGLLIGHRSCPNYTHRIARHHSPYAVLMRGAGAGAAGARGESVAGGRRGKKREPAKKTPAPAGEDPGGALCGRRGGGGGGGGGDRGGVSADRGCNSGLVGLFAY